MICVIGSLNMDLVMNTKCIPNPGETVIGEKFSTVPGGKGANQAVAAARAGASTAMIGKLGDDSFGSTLIQGLAQDGVHTKGVQIVSGASSGVALISVGEDGSNSIIVSPEANSRMSPADIDFYGEIIKASDLILLQNKIPLKVNEYVIEKGAQMGKAIIYNPAPAMVVDSKLWSKVNFLVPNEHELTQIYPGEPSSADEMGMYLVNRGVQHVILTLGEKGCRHYSQEGIKVYPAYKVEVVDTTVAGDTFVGSFAAWYENSKQIDKAIQFAMMAAGVSVTKFGAQTSIPSRKEVEEMMGEHYCLLIKGE